MKWFKLVLLIALMFVLGGCGKQPVTTDQDSLSSPTPKTASKTSMLTSTETPEVVEKVTLKTSKGEVEIELYNDQAPNTVKNFVSKVKAGYYEGLIFHRVEDWVVQGGDPKGTGTGGGNMPTELNKVPFEVGSVGVARGGDIKISNDSQFFICTTDCGFLTGQYTNFGKVTKGMEIVKQIEIGDKILKIVSQK